MDNLSFAQQIAVWALPVLFAITLHEAAHGWAAMRLGDPTAKMLGRLTLNPIKHIDPIGTVLVPAVLLLLGGFIFGWARPVPITVRNLRRPKRDMALVAAAGPAANLLMALMWALVVRLGLAIGGSAEGVATYLVYTGQAGMLINAVLMVLNLLPLPPLDGGRVASGVMPGRWSYHFDRIEPYGFFILLALLATGLLGAILGPFVHLFLNGFYAVAGIY